MLDDATLASTLPIDDVLAGVLREALAAAGPFAALDPAAREALAARATRCSFAAGDVIVRAGGAARAMYVLLVGHVQVYVEDEAGRTRVLAKLGPGAFFGEQALLPGREGRRNASVRAHSLVILARIDRATLGDFLQRTGGLAERLAAVGDAQIVRRFAEETALRLDLVDAAALEGGVERALHDGEVIFRKGDPARDVYLVLRGTVAVYDEEDGARTLLTRIGAGQCFGELALIRRAPRAATVLAEGEAAVLALDGTRFLDLYERSPTLRQTLSTFERAYALPRRGLVTQFAGDLEGEPCLTVVYELPDGRGAMASLAAEREVYRLDVRDPRILAGAPTTRHAYRDPAGAVVREITLDAGGAVTALASVGHWPELSLLHELAVEGHPLPAEALLTFAEDGRVALRAPAPAVPEADPLCCRCTGVRRSAIMEARADGCATLPQLRARLGCGSICGGCIPSLQELLGDEVWTAVDLVEEVPLTPEVRAFRLRPSRGAARSFQPGQHLVIRARIDGAYVERSYTLTSPAKGADHYEITVKREPMGLFSRWLFDGGAREATLQVAGPQGDVYWEGGARPVVCVVAGIGVTPAVAILRARALSPGAGALHVHYSVRTRAEAPYADEILAAAADPAVRVTLRETATEGRLGREDLERIAESMPDATFFLCGPNRFLATVAALLAGLGVAKGRVHVERFVHAGDVPLLEPPDPSAAEHVLQDPPPVRRSLGDAAATAGFRALEPLAASPVGTGAGGAVRPRPRWAERLLIRAAGIDPAVPSSYGATPSLVVVGTYASQMRTFGRPSPYVANRALARAARARGAPLPPDTPDGDTFFDVVPAAPLRQFEGPGGVDTGWRRSAEGALLPVVITRAPSAIRAILGAPRAADRGPIPYHYVQQAMGIPRRCPVEGGVAGLFGGCYGENATWTRDRETALDHLAPGGLERDTSMLTASLADVEAALSAMIAESPRRVIDLGRMMRQVALRLVVRVLFGLRHDQDLVALANEVVAAVDPGLRYVALSAFGVPGQAEALSACTARAREAMTRLVDRIRAHAVAGELTERQQELPVVHRIVQLVNGAPAQADRLFTLLLPLVVAGHETTAHALSWAFYELCRDPALAREVRAEIDAYRAFRAGGPIRLVDYDRRPWTLALFLETTRLYALIPYTTRVTREAGEIPPNPATGIGAFRYPKGTEMVVSFLGAHLDPEIYPDPLAFRPQRFLEGLDPSLPAHRLGRAVRQRAWDLEAAGSLVGFGAGTAECPGRGMAMFEFFLVVDHLFGRFDVELVDPTRRVRIGKELLSAPEPGGIAATIRRRR